MEEFIKKYSQYFPYCERDRLMSEMKNELSKTEQPCTIHSVIARLLVLFFALLMFTMFRTVLNTE